jgi:predicted metalloprotease
MRYDDLPQSDNIEDRRGDGGGGGGGGFPIGGGGLGIGTIVVLGIIGYALGIDPRLLIGGAEMVTGGGQRYEQPESRPSGKAGAPSDEMGKFVSQILGSADVQWKQIFEQSGKRYRAPTLVMFTGATRADACGQAQSAMGPFYCPPDNKIYLDTSFFREIERRFRGCDVGSSACKFAQAYVIAHEIGHHVQNQLGILSEVQQRQRGLPKAEANRLQVRVELQADCFAGVWGHHADRARGLLERGDLEEGLRAAAAIGDDTLQRAEQGAVVPESFTHGSSAQRVQWFKRGFQSGRVNDCNTFEAAG